jgi:hypothetical protein
VYYWTAVEMGKFIDVGVEKVRYKDSEMGEESLI